MNSSSGKTLRVAVVGCGQIADAHLQELRKVPAVEIAATCDVHRDLAMQAALRFGVPRYDDDLDTMLREVKPDVVHVATPAHTHSAVAQAALAAGAHVYVEKPFTVDAREATQVLQAARARGLHVCVGHDQLFDPAWLELRRLVAEHRIGDVRHVESVLGYPVAGQFGKAVQADPNHWVRRLPGGLFQNTISHPLYRITEFLADETPEIVGRWWSMPGRDFPSELLVHMRGRDVTGTLTFATTIASQRVTRVYGTRGTLEVDLDAQTVIRSAPPGLPGAFGKLEAPFRRRAEAARVLRRNVARFLRSEIHYFAGMKTLFERFCEAARDPSKPCPIAPSETLRVTRLMDDIFEQCRSAAAAAATPLVPAKSAELILMPVARAK